MMSSKLFASIFSLLVLFAILLPIRENWQKKPQDSFPLSYYPMFSLKRGETNSLNYFVGYDINGNRHYIPYNYIGNGGFNQVRRQINKQCRKGKEARLTKKVARRLAKCKEQPFNGLERVELVNGTYHLETYFLTDNKMPLEEKILHTQIIEKP